MLHNAAPVLRKNEILITTLEWDNIHILPSKSDLFFNETKDCFIVRGCIVNLTEHKIKGEVTGKFEILGTYSAHLISAENQPKIKDLMWSNPPVKEIYPYNRDLDLKIPSPTINNLNISKNKFTTNLISESNTEEDITLTLPDTLEKEVLGGNKVTYTGE